MLQLTVSIRPLLLLLVNKWFRCHSLMRSCIILLGNAIRNERIVPVQSTNKAFFSLWVSMKAEVTWVWLKWGKVWSQSFTLWFTLGGKTLRWDWLPGFFVFCDNFWQDTSLSATNFARPLKLLTPQPLEAGRVGGGVSASSLGGTHDSLGAEKKAPDSAEREVTSPWASPPQRTRLLAARDARCLWMCSGQLLAG